MARCNIGNHGNCASCGILVNGTSRYHVHIYSNGYAQQYDTVCAECYTTFCTASLKILRALTKAGVALFEPPALRHFILEHVQVAIDMPLDLLAPSQN